MDDKYRGLIADEFSSCVHDTITRVSQREWANIPFHSALLPEEVIFWSAFERSFSTSLGQRVIEKVAYLAALSNGAEAVRQKETFITIDSAYEGAIRTHMHSLRSKSHTVESWASVLHNILSTPKTGQMTPPIRVISDLWWRKDGIDHFISIKTVKPNIDQTAVAKEDCLHLAAASPSCKTYFGLPYNPYGANRSDYAFNPPMGIFDFHNDPVVLIGREMWDTIGGPGCYDEVIAIAQEVGIGTKKEIRSQFPQ